LSLPCFSDEGSCALDPSVVVPLRPTIEGVSLLKVSGMKSLKKEH
jgi:hypothetical protein